MCCACKQYLGEVCKDWRSHDEENFCLAHDLSPEMCLDSSLTYFYSHTCCVCGGGTIPSGNLVPDDGQEVCENTDNGAVDKYGDDCSFYDDVPS